MEIRSLESQLTSIVDAPRARTAEPPSLGAGKKADPASSPSGGDVLINQVSSAVSREFEVYNAHRKDGREGEYLQKSAESMNNFFGEMNLDLRFKIEKTDSGFVVSVLDENGKVIKTIPGKEIVETRKRISEMIKGIFEDRSP